MYSTPLCWLYHVETVLIIILCYLLLHLSVSQESRNIAGALAFWLANTSELLTFLKRDPQLVPFTADFEGSLTSIVHTAYKNFTQCMLKELSLFLPAFHDDSGEADSEEGYISGGEAATIANTGGAGAGGAGGGGGVGKEPDIVAGSRPPISRQSSITGMYWSVAGSKIRRRGRPTIGDILATLNSTIALLNRCFVNKTLSIMIFSLLFRYISTKLFNKVVMEPKYCSQSVGQKLRRRLDRVREWAEKEGMELPAEKHLSMIVQVGVRGGRCECLLLYDCTGEWWSSGVCECGCVWGEM